MTVPPLDVFPRHPIRDIRVRFTRQTCAGNHFAEVVLDLEPSAEGPVGGLTLEVAQGADLGEPHGELPLLLDSLTRGMAEGLAGGADRPAPAAVLVVRHVRTHPLDSGRMSFHIAGRLAADVALQRALPATADPGDRWPGDTA